MLITELKAPVVRNHYGEYLVEISRDGLVRYVRMKNVPGQWSGVEGFYKRAMEMPFHEIADDLLTSEVHGGLSSIDDPHSFDLESGVSHRDKGAGYRSLRFDHFQIEQIDPSRPRRGRIIVHYSPLDGDDDSRTLEPELAIQFDISYPSVALFLSDRHPEPWLSEFYDELEEARDSIMAASVFVRYARDESWRIGIPRRFGSGISNSAGTEFLDKISRDNIINLIHAKFPNDASRVILSWAHGLQEMTMGISDILRVFDLGELSGEMRRFLVENEMGV